MHYEIMKLIMHITLISNNKLETSNSKPFNSDRLTIHIHIYNMNFL